MSASYPASEGAEGTPPPTRRRGSWARRRLALLTAALVLYTVALCIAVGDEVLDLGLFPTRLERQARGFIARFALPDEAERQAALDELIREVDAFVAIPELIRALGARSPATRETAVDGLRRLSKTRQDYDPAAPIDQRRAATGRWRLWWKANQHRF